jgi:hypothetical protein
MTPSSGIDVRERSLQVRPMSANEGGPMSRTTIGASLAAVIVVAAAVLVLVAPADAAGSRVGFGFNAASISGFQSGGKVFLTGGGSYNPVNVNPESFVHSSGGFRCIQGVERGPLNGCLDGQGIRWDTEELLASTGFKCTGAATEAAKTAVTDAHTAVLKSDFYRAGDGDDASFEGVKVIVSDHDLADDIDGVQNVWIEQVGCGEANVSFSS